MSERAHTKGPWSVGFSDGSGPEWITAGDDTTIVMGGDSFGTVYGVRDPANACLIAAAPDMFEALIQAREWLRGWASAEAQLAIIDAALAKATTGESSDVG
jgi:hypothetical protein